MDKAPDLIPISSSFEYEPILLILVITKPLA